MSYEKGGLPPPAAMYDNPGPPPAYSNPQAGPSQGATMNTTMTMSNTNTIVIGQPMMGGTTTTIIRHGGYFNEPVTTQCKACGKIAMTRVDSSLSSKGILCIVLLAIFIFWPCCLLPLCMPSCYDHRHYCSNCQTLVATNYA